MKRPPLFLQLSILALSAPLGIAQPAVPAPAEVALRDLRLAANPVLSSPPVPGQALTKQQVEAARKQQADGFLAAAAAARDFQTRFPNHPDVTEARKIEVFSLLRAVRSGATARETEALRLAETYIADERNTRRDRYLAAASVKQWLVDKKNIKGKAALFAEYEKNAAELSAQFADVPDMYYLFIGLARNAPETRAVEILSDLLKASTSEAVKVEARMMLDRLTLRGTAPDIKFVTTNGGLFDLQNERGTPVVIYFWTGSLPADALDPIRAAAASSTARFVGVNVDTDPRVIRDMPGPPLPGPQRWEPRGLNVGLVRQLCATQIPSVYVFDRNGRVHGFGPPRDLPALLSAAGK